MRRRNVVIAITLLLVLASVIAGGLIMALASILATVLTGNGGGHSITIVTEAVIVAILLAGRSLDDHVRAVAIALRDAAASSNLDAARQAVSMIVGRNPDTLMNTPSPGPGSNNGRKPLRRCDRPGTVYLVFGLPGIIAYKMINT